MSVNILVNGKLVTLTNAEWAAQNPPAPPTSVPVPAQVSNVQGHAILIQRGLRDQAQAAITAITDPTERQMAQLAFERGAFLRSSPMVATLSAALNLSSGEVDQMFRDAAKVLI